MSTRRVCSKPQMLLHRVLKRSSKPPDVQSIQVLKMNSELSVMKRELINAKLRSKSYEDELDRLREKVVVLSRERDESKVAYVKEKLAREDIQRCNDRLEQRVSRILKDAEQNRVESDSLHSDCILLRSQHDKDQEELSILKSQLIQSSMGRKHILDRLKMAVMFNSVINADMDVKKT